MKKSNGLTSEGANNPGRREFIHVLTVTAGAFGFGALNWPLIAQMGVAADGSEKNGPIVDLRNIKEGQHMRILVFDKVVFVRHRTPGEIQEATDVILEALRDPETDRQRLKPKPDGSIDPRYLVLYGHCTHFGCLTIAEQGQKNPRSRYGGWYCPCHGAEFDTSGRVRSGPPRFNMEVPNYRYLSEYQIKFRRP